VRVVVGDGSAACDADEIMVAGYCAGDNATFKKDGTTGAHCYGDSDARAIVSCAPK